MDDENSWQDTYNKEALVEILLELDFEFNNYKTISEVSETREEFEKETEDELRKILGTILHTTDLSDKGLQTALTEKYPDGVILSHNNTFHQWGVVV